METVGGGILSRIGERILSWIALGLLVAIGIGVWQMAPETRAAILSGIWRTAAWVALVIAIPWSAYFYVRRLLDAGSNTAGMLLLIGLAAADIVLALLLATAWPVSLWGWVAALAALALAATYNYLVVEYLADTAGG